MCLRATVITHVCSFPWWRLRSGCHACIAGHRAALPCFLPCPFVDCTCAGLIGVARRLPPYTERQILLWDGGLSRSLPSRGMKWVWYDTPTAGTW